MRRSLASVAALATVISLTSACSSASDTESSSDETTSTSSPTEFSPTESTPVEETTSEETTPAETDSTDSGDGQTLAGQGYRTSIPSGWEDVTARAKQSQPAVDVAVAAPASGDFRTNINVVKPNPAPAGLSDQELAKRAAAELKSVTHTKVKPLPGVEFSGEPSIGQTSIASVPGVEKKVALVQYLVVHDDKIYAVTLSFEASKSSEAKQAMTEFVGNWAWTS